MAGDEGFEPPITGPEPGALPLGQSPISLDFARRCSRQMHQAAKYYRRTEEIVSNPTDFANDLITDGSFGELRAKLLFYRLQRFATRLCLYTLRVF